MIGRLVGRIRAALTTSKELEQVLIAGGSETNAGVPVTPEKALRAAAVAAAVGIIAESVAQLPLHFYRRLDRGKERVRDNPTAALLSGRPNVFQNGFEFIETLTSHMVLWGNAYAVKITSGRRLIELLPIHPNRVDVSQDNRYRLNYSVSLQNGEYLELPSDRVLHLRDRSLDGITGISRVMLGKDSVGLALQTERHGARLFANGVRPSGILTTDVTLSKEAIDKLRAAFTAASGGEGAYGVPVLDNGIKFASMSMESDKAQFLETRKFQIAEVARMFRVPPHMLGDLDRATFANVEQMSLEFVQYTLMPWLRRWEYAINTQLLGPGDVFAEFLVDGLLRGDFASRVEGYSKALMDGWLSVNEVRELENRSPIDGGDEYRQAESVFGPNGDRDGPDPTA